MVTNAVTTVDPSLEDKDLMEKEARFRMVSYHISEVRKASEKLMFKQLEMSAAMDEFSRKLAEYAPVEGELKDTIMEVAKYENQMSKEYEKHAGMMAQLLDEPFQDHLGMLQSAQDMGAARNTAALTLTNARIKTAQKRQENDAEKHKGAGAGRAAQMDVELGQVQRQQEAAQSRLTKFDEHIPGEIDRFHKHRSSDLKAIMCGYAGAASSLANQISKQRTNLKAKLSNGGASPQKPTAPPSPTILAADGSGSVL